MYDRIIIGGEMKNIKEGVIKEGEKGMRDKNNFMKNIKHRDKVYKYKKKLN